MEKTKKSIRFKQGNKIQYGQDFRYKNCVPDIVFVIDEETKDDITIIADGFGFGIGDRPEGQYGNGSLHISKYELKEKEGQWESDNWSIKEEDLYHNQIKHTKIHFEYEGEKQTSVLIKRGDKTIGRVWSEQSNGGLPYPSDATKTYCKNAIQICGFDKISEIWQCGPFKGKKDCVVSFLPIDDEYYQEKLKKYGEYVRGFIETEIKKLENGAGEFNMTEIKFRKHLYELKSFNEWIEHEI